jgi:hypothetical protein
MGSPIELDASTRTPNPLQGNSVDFCLSQPIGYNFVYLE